MKKQSGGNTSSGLATITSLFVPKTSVSIVIVVLIVLSAVLLTGCIDKSDVQICSTTAPPDDQNDVDNTETHTHPDASERDEGPPTDRYDRETVAYSDLINIQGVDEKRGTSYTGWYQIHGMDEINSLKIDARTMQTGDDTVIQCTTKTSPIGCERFFLPKTLDRNLIPGFDTEWDLNPSSMIYKRTMTLDDYNAELMKIRTHGNTILSISEVEDSLWCIPFGCAEERYPDPRFTEYHITGVSSRWGSDCTMMIVGFGPDAYVAVSVRDDGRLLSSSFSLWETALGRGEFKQSPEPHNLEEVSISSEQLGYWILICETTTRKRQLTKEEREFLLSCKQKYTDAGLEEWKGVSNNREPLYQYTSIYSGQNHYTLRNGKWYKFENALKYE